MIYVCNKCGFIHEGTVPDGYFCPLCNAGLNDFKLISEEQKEYKCVTINKKNVCINRTDEKCINCGACRNTCENVVGIKFNKKPICIGCGKCVLSCPTGAMTPYYNYREVWELINIPGKTVVVMTSPAVRVAIGDAFDFAPGKFLEGKMVSALKALGFDYVFDVSFGADLTAFEEAAELKERIKNKHLPMFTSCCPSWIKFADTYHKELKEKISSCKSPIGMQASVIREIFAKEEGIKTEDLIIVALTPCTSKKEEVLESACDYVITTSELALLLREQNIDFKNIDEEDFDSLIGSASGTSFGVSGGVMLSTLRCLYFLETNKDLTDEQVLIKKQEFYTEYRLKINGELIKCASVSTMFNLEKILPVMNEFSLIEVMNCEGGCISGGGQIIMPIKDMPDILIKRRKSLDNSKNRLLKYPYYNSALIELYEDFLEKPLSDKAKMLLHKR